jgi:predicted ATPase
MESQFLKEGLLLRSVTKNKLGTSQDVFPFDVPVIRSLTTLEFTAQVTILVGENGCGKSTLLEAIACASGAVTMGSEGVEADPSLAALRALGKALKLVWTKKTHRGFFMRSEDFFGYARKMTAMREELQKNLEDVEIEYKDRSLTAKLHARSSYARELGALSRDYDRGLDARSHGESYLKLFQARFVPEGFYLLDEPEAPLSPIRQLSFLAILKTMVDQKSQFIIATHSPILMAFPGAAILSLDGGEIRRVEYQDVEHVRVTKDFLNNPQSFLKNLLES